MSRSRPVRGGTKLRALLERGAKRAFPAWQASVSIAGEVVFEGAGGGLEAEGATFTADGTSAFDLASLTKPLVTVSCCMALSALGRLPLDTPLAELLGRPVAGGPGITPRRLLSHASGLPAWRPLHLEVPPLAGGGALRRAAILRAALDTRRAAEHGGALYSDVGFLQLTALLEHLEGRRIDRVFAERVGAEGLFFRPLEEAEADRRVAGFVPTERDARRGLLAGRVNDENAYAMGGISGHAGLFGAASAVRRHVQSLVDAWKGRASWVPQGVVREYWTPAASGSTWALGWDTPSATGSSAGIRPPADAVGHLGFTGTSIWVWPAREAIAVLLTNRVWPDRTNDAIRSFRPLFHDLVWAMA